MNGIGLVNTSRLRVVVAMVLVVWASGAADAQTWGGSYQGDGYTVNWSLSIGRGGNIHIYQFSNEGFEEVIEGPDVELVREGEEDVEAVERAEVYRVLDYARDLMSGRFMREFEGLAKRAEEAGLDPLQRLTHEQMKQEVIAAYGLHLSEHPEDWMVVREMAVALLNAGRVDDAMNMMHEAYLKTPELGILPLNRTILGESEEPLRKLVIRAVQQTNRKPSAEGWLLVGVLMQAQGRVESAGEMIDRAEELGLESEIVAGLRKALP